ncbi:MAG: hypothetical protein LBT91_03190 [Bifidobacteriaceae bacterium]|jgi:hypothetical protein|nr:hypothetical protein [Bifidobacteriaceae bacterium]
MKEIKLTKNKALSRQQSRSAIFLINLIIFSLIFSLGLIETKNIQAASSQKPLSVSQGGTGTNAFSNEGALTGQGQNPLTVTPIESAAQKNSPNLITSGGVLKSAAEKISTDSVLTLNENYFHYYDYITIMRIGNFLSITGEIYAKANLTAGTSYKLFDVAQKYLPGKVISGTCTYDIFQGGIVGLENPDTPSFDCGLKITEIYIQSHALYTDVGTPILLNFFWPIGTNYSY